MHTARYHGVILDAVPRPCRRALEIGCGSGAFAIKLAGLAHELDALDRSPEMIGRAPSLPNARFVCADFVIHPLEPGYDFVCALAALHHMPLVAALTRMKALLSPGGVLAVIGLYRDASLVDLAHGALSFPVSRWLRATRPRMNDGAPICEPRTTLAEIRTAAARLLPGSVVERRLLWRYTLLYRAPGDRASGLR